MYAMILTFQLFLQMTLFEQGFALDNLDEFQRHKRLSNNGDYIGCYALGCLHFDFDVDYLDNLTTPDSCTSACKENGFPLAGVYNGTTCSCACAQTCLEAALDNKKCGLPCRSAPTKLCGGYTAVSVYTVRNPVALKDLRYCHLENEKASNTTYSDPQSSWLPITVPISIPGGIFLIIIVAVILVYRRQNHTSKERDTIAKIARKDRETTDKRRYRLRLRDKRVQERKSNVPPVPQYQTLEKALHKLPDIPQDADVAATTSSDAGFREGIYEDPDLEDSTVPRADYELSHEYLVSGQGVPSRSSSADEHHEYDYADVCKNKLKAPVKGIRISDDGYLLAEPDIQGLQNIGSKVYYSSRLLKSQNPGEVESSESPKNKVYNSAGLHRSHNQGVSRPPKISDPHTYSAHVPRAVDEVNIMHSGPRVYYSTRLHRSDDRVSNISSALNIGEEESYIEVKEN